MKVSPAGCIYMKGSQFNPKIHFPSNEQQGWLSFSAGNGIIGIFTLEPVR
jgi:hypothetical protein